MRFYGLLINRRSALALTKQSLTIAITIESKRKQTNSKEVNNRGDKKVNTQDVNKTEEHLFNMNDRHFQRTN